jgi:hypothetical protein
MELWLKGHGYPEEAPLPTVQRKFDLGHLIEAAVFNARVIEETSAENGGVGRWWASAEPLTDYSTGEVYEPKGIEIQNRQEEVEDEGVLGHLDGIGGPDPFRVMDSKSMVSFSFKKNLRDDLMENVFSREMVMQQQAYIAGARKKFPALGIEEWMLVMVNRDDLKMAVRVGQYDPALVDEGRERRSWAKSKQEPVPDYEWTKGEDIPTRCRYCSLKYSCAEVRGTPIKLVVELKGPRWVVAA